MSQFLVRDVLRLFCLFLSLMQSWYLSTIKEGILRMLPCDRHELLDVIRSNTEKKNSLFTNGCKVTYIYPSPKAQTPPGESLVRFGKKTFRKFRDDFLFLGPYNL